MPSQDGNTKIVESFITSNKPKSLNNKNIYYNEYSDEVLIRYYQTLIAVRKGKSVRILEGINKYSASTNILVRLIERIAEEHGCTVSYVKQFAKGGGLKNKAKYIPNRLINEIEVERNGRTTTIDGADLLDGAYVKKNVKFAKGGGVDLDKDKFSLASTNDDLVEMVIGENWTAKQFKEHFLNKGYELKSDTSIVGFYFSKPNGQTFQLVPSFHKRGEILKYAKGSTIKGVVEKLVGSYGTKEKAEKMKKVFENAVSTQKGESFYIKKTQSPNSELKYDLFKIKGYAKGSTVKGHSDTFKEVIDFGSETYFIRNWGHVGTDKFDKIDLVAVATIKDLENYVSENELPEEGNFELDITLVPTEKYLSKKHTKIANDDNNSMSDNAILNIVNYMGGLYYQPQDKVHFKTFEDAKKYMLSKELNDKISAQGMMSGFVLDMAYNRAGQTNWDYLAYMTGESQKFGIMGIYGNGGGVAISSESGLAVGTNADLLMNQQNLQYGSGGAIKSADEGTGSSSLRERAQAKIDKGVTVIDFSYTDYGGNFFDKVAIAYFKKHYPKNILVENSGYNGQNAFVFGKVADEYLEAIKNYLLGFEDMETFYFEMQVEIELKAFKWFVKELKSDGYKVSPQTLDWLMENKSGYYHLEPNMLDFNDEDLKDELIEEGLVSKKFGNGGGVAVSSQSGYVMGTNADEWQNQYALGGGIDDKYKLTLKSWDADIYEDSYEEGEGEHVNSFGEKVNKSFSSGEELLEYINDNILYHNAKKEHYNIMDDGRIVTSVLVDVDNSSASKSEIEEWKKGNGKLYSANYNFYVTLTHEKTPSDEELSKMLGISIYRKGGSVKKYSRVSEMDSVEDTKSHFGYDNESWNELSKEEKIKMRKLAKEHLLLGAKSNESSPYWDYSIGGL
jgi:hypothetical protein